MAAHLLVLGSVNADLYVEVPRFPAAGETLRGSGMAVRPGGKGANQAAAAARLGCPTRFIGQVGQDAFATDLRTALEASGVDCRHLASVPGSSGQAIILLQPGGENAIILAGGANLAWEALPLGFGPLLTGAGALLLQCEVPEAINLAAAQAAYAAGIPVVLDAGGMEAPPAEALLQRVQVFSPNETELSRLTGMPTATPGQATQAARTLQAAGARKVLVKLGARGCLLVGPGEALLEQPAFPVEVVDTTGAGDCFTAAYAVGLLEALPERERLRRASAAAALCVGRKGALPSMPERSAVEAFLAGP